VVASPDARAEGFGQVVPGPPGADGLAGVGRLQHQDARQPDTVWNGSFLPTKAELNILPPAKK
jgi:NitT/TauT family transport system substrate-binding protein